MQNRRLEKCCVCGSQDLSCVLKLPNLPLTGLYFNSKEEALNSPVIDQAFNICESCGHGQLDIAVDPKVVYDSSYTHRSSESEISKGSNDFFIKNLKDSKSLSNKKKVIEIGCNDGYMLKKISKFIDYGYGIDPIWIDQEYKAKSNFEIKGGYASNIKSLIPKNFNPNLVLSSHTFEHTIDLFEDLKLAVDIASDNSIFHIEMPSLDSLIKLRRFDQIFHQHIQYISESSIEKLVNRLNCNLLSINYNYNLWGGTVLFSFKKERVRKAYEKKINFINEKSIGKSLADFRNYISLLNTQMSFYDDFYYLGAAQMLPILNYHFNVFNKKASLILDDNESRINKFLPNMSTLIAKFDNHIVKPTSAYLIGAVDSSKAITKRAREKNIPNLYSLFQNLI